MKPSTLIKAATFAAIIASGVAKADNNLILNGDFETTVFGAFSGYNIANAGTSTIANWTIGGTSVDVIRGSYGAISGNSIDMLGTPGPGSLSQGFATVAGHDYTVSFDLSANGVGGDSKALTVTVGAAPAFNFVGDMNNHATETFNYHATTTGLTQLTFTSAASGYSGAVIDNVSVTGAVPEPETYAMLLAGLGMVGFIARRKAAKKAA